MLRSLVAVALFTLALFRRELLAQASARADQDSIEVVALRFAKAALPAGRSFIFEPRVRTAAGSWADARSQAQVARLLTALNARLGTLGCTTSPSSACTAPLQNEIGVVLEQPNVTGDQATITVEHYFPRGMGSETYLVTRDSGTWKVTRITARSAT